MARKLISSGSRFEGEVGYSRAVVDGDFVFVAGCTGYDYATMTISGDVVAQCEQTFRNIETALTQAGATLADVVRVTYIVPNRADWPACWPVLRKHFGDVRPAATMIVCGLASEDMKIEIEVTARRRQS
jgi:enamine deaminase RidA (YjgF/YER057c/UK114 family)